MFDVKPRDSTELADESGQTDGVRARRPRALAAARTALVVLVALVVAAVPPAAAAATGPSAGAGGSATAAVAASGAAVGATATATPADPPHKNATANDTGGEVRTRDYPFPAPDRETMRERRAVANEVAYANETVAEMVHGALAVQTGYGYAPDSGVVTMKTWHRQRVVGDWQRGLRIVFTEGYVAEATVDPDAEAVAALDVSRRRPEVVRKSYTAAEKAAVSVALANGTVASLLADTDHYVSMVRNDFRWGGASCSYETCYAVTFDRVNHPGQVAVQVSPPDDRVVGVSATDWSAPAASSPDVSTTDASTRDGAATDGATSADGLPTRYDPGTPSSDGSVGTAESGDGSAGTAQSSDSSTDGSVGTLATGTVSMHNWQVTYTSTDDNGTRVSSVRHNGTTVLFQAQVPQIDVYYPNLSNPLRDDLGFPSSGPTVNNFTTGFSITTTYYLGCTASTYGPNSDCYKYVQVWQFWQDGTMNPWMEIYGPGFEDDFGAPQYDTHWRFDTDVEGFDNDTVRAYTSLLGWIPFENETHTPAIGVNDSRGNEWSIVDTDTGLTAFVDPYGPDDADAYALRYEPVSDTQPEDLVTGEHIRATDVMFYYVSHTEYGNQGCTTTFPCIPGSTWEVF